MIIQWIEGYPIVSDKPILYLLFTRVYPCFKVDEGLPEIGTRCFWMWRMWMPGAVSSWGSFLKKLSHTLRLLNSLLWKMVRWFMMIYDYLWWFMMIYDDLWWFMMIWIWFGCEKWTWSTGILDSQTGPLPIQKSLPADPVWVTVSSRSPGTNDLAGRSKPVKLVFVSLGRNGFPISWIVIISNNLIYWI